MNPTDFNFKVHWYYKNERIFLRRDLLIALPRVGDEVRQSSKTFYTVTRLVWCLDEALTEGQRVNIELEKAK